MIGLLLQVTRELRPFGLLVMRLITLDALDDGVQRYFVAVPFAFFVGVYAVAVSPIL